MSKNNLINLKSLENNLYHEYFDISSYLYSLTKKNVFLSLIKEEKKFFLEKELSYNLEINLLMDDINELQENSFFWELENLKEEALRKENTNISSFLLKVIHTKKIPTLIYNNLYSEIKENSLTLRELEEILKKGNEEIAKQQAFCEWCKNSLKPKRGIIEQIKEKGIYTKSPFWHYDKALEKIFDALRPEENSNLFIMSSPSTYHQLLKKKILSSYQNNISQDSWDYKGKAYIPILSIPEIPNTIIIIASPNDFIRGVKHPFMIEKKKENNSLIGKGSFSNELIKKDSSAYIELYLS